MTKQNKNIIIGAVVVVVVLVAIFFMQKSSTKVVENGAGDVKGAEIQPQTKRFSGVVSSVDTSCFADGVCSVTIDGKKIILEQGGRSLPPGTMVGKLIGVDSIGDLETKIGAFANVYAELTFDGNYTLYGNSDYYVEITLTSDK